MGNDSDDSDEGEKGVDEISEWRCERKRFVRSSSDFGLPHRDKASVLCKVSSVHDPDFLKMERTDTPRYPATLEFHGSD